MHSVRKNGSAQRGYGFIQPVGGSKDTLVNVSAVERAGWGTLKLSYELTTG